MDTKYVELLRVLTQIGLDHREAVFYLAALGLGKGLVSEIALQAGLNRSASYDVLRSLKGKGLVSTLKITRGIVVLPSDPGRLLNIHQERYEALAEQMENLRYLFTVAKQEPGVKMYEGIEGMKQVFQMELDEAREICIFGDGEAFKKAVPTWSEEQAKKRLFKKIKTRLLLKASPHTIRAAKEMAKNKEKVRYTQIRVLPNAFPIVGGFDIFADKVVLFSFDEKNIAVVIESKIIRTMMQSVFDMLWNMAEVYNHTLLK